MQRLPEVINEEEYELAKWLVNHGSSCTKWNSWVAWIHVSDRPLITQIYLIRVVSTLQGCGTKLHQWLRLKKYVCERFRHLRWAKSPAHMTQVSMKLTLVKAMPIIIALCQNIFGAATFKDAANETRIDYSCCAKHSWIWPEHSCWHSWNRTEQPNTVAGTAVTEPNTADGTAVTEPNTAAGTAGTEPNTAVGTARNELSAAAAQSTAWPKLSTTQWWTTLCYTTEIQGQRSRWTKAGHRSRDESYRFSHNSVPDLRAGGVR